MDSRRECRSSSELHRIRLRGPWQCEPLRAEADASASELPPGGRLQIPDDWGTLLGDFLGTVRFTRRFGRPSGLESHERVELVIERVGDSGHARLNGNELGRLEPQAGPYRFDITGLLEPRNELQLDTASGASSRDQRSRGVVGEVRLEIRTK